MAKIYNNGYHQCKKMRQDYSEYCFIHKKKEIMVELMNLNEYYFLISIYNEL